MATKLLKHMYIILLAIYFKYVFSIFYIAPMCQIGLVPFIIVFTAQLYIAVIFKALYITFVTLFSSNYKSEARGCTTITIQDSQGKIPGLTSKF